MRLKHLNVRGITEKKSDAKVCQSKEKKKERKIDKSELDGLGFQQDI